MTNANFGSPMVTVTARASLGLCWKLGGERRGKQARIPEFKYGMQWNKCIVRYPSPILPLHAAR